MAFSIEMISELQYVLIWGFLPGKLCAWAENIWPAVGTVSRCGYNGQQKATICDAHGTIRRTPKWVSTYSLNLQVAQMSKCWDLAILVQTTDDRRQTNQLFYSYRWESYYLSERDHSIMWEAGTIPVRLSCNHKVCDCMIASCSEVQ